MNEVAFFTPLLREFKKKSSIPLVPLMALVSALLSLAHSDREPIAKGTSGTGAARLRDSVPYFSCLRHAQLIFLVELWLTAFKVPELWFADFSVPVEDNGPRAGPSEGEWVFLNHFFKS